VANAAFVGKGGRVTGVPPAALAMLRGSRIEYVGASFYLLAFLITYHALLVSDSVRDADGIVIISSVASPGWWA
jgi:hypothetical protein